MRTGRLGLLLFLFVSLVVPATAREPKPGKNLIDNGSFEQTVPGKVPKDIGHGAWTLGGAGRMPDGWSLNVAYPGVLTVLEKDAAEGTRCIQVAAGTERDAQMFRSCPAMRPGRWYRVSVRVRAGTGTLLTYEYATGGAPEAQTLASVTAPRDEWRTVTGFYAPRAEKFESAAVVLLVPKGGKALFDDVRVDALKGPVADPRARPVRLSNEAAELVISGAGQLQTLTLKDGQNDLADKSHRTPVLAALRDGVRMPVATLSRKGGTLTARFPDPAVSVKLRVKVHERYFLFEVVDVKPKDLEGLDLRFPVKPLQVRDAWMPGTYGDTAGITHMGVSANTQTRLARYGLAVVPEARWWRQPGIRGGRSALIATATKDFLPTIRRMELETGLPSPVLKSSIGDATATSDWARVSPAIKRSYLFATYLGFGDIDALIRYAKEGGFGLIMLHRKSWRASAGHETIARTAFPEGLPTLAAVCKRIHDAGLGVGLHLYGPAVSTNDAYVTPVPDERLFAYTVGQLAAAAAADATELVLKERPALPRKAAPDLHPGNLLRLGDEIVRWREIAPGTPVRLLGCERGALGTTAKAHRKGALVRTFVMRYGQLLVDPDSDLPEEMGAHLARVVNACQADLVYFDACESGAPGRKPESWYYLNRVLLASCAEFDHGAMVQWSLGPGRQLGWHLVPRSASADGHGDLKGYLDKRMPGIRQMLRTHTAADIGWYALDLHGRPDELEYVCAKALALDASISVQAHKPLLELHPRAREVFDMIARWERLRLSGVVSAEVRALIAKPGLEVRALETDEGTSLWEALYDPERAVTRMDGKANLWSMRNERKAPARLAVEIQRVAIAATPQAHAAPEAISVEPFRDPAALKLRGDETLAKHILIGGRALTADGFGRRGVKTTLQAVRDPSIGSPAVEMRVASSFGGAGWGAAGKTLAEPLDLSEAKSLGLWVGGDGRGATLALTLVDAAGQRARSTVTLDYDGWRFQSFARSGPQAFDWSRVAHLLLELSHVPPKATVSVRVSALKAMPTLHVPRPMPSVTIAVGRREVDLNVALAPGQVVTVDALARGVFWPGGMREGSMAQIPGGPLVLPPGLTKVGVALQDPAGYAGDLRVRFCRTWPLEP